MWRLLGALELLPVKTRIAVGEMIVQNLVAGRLAPVRPALSWTLGRLGARQPSYGPLNMVIPADVVSGPSVTCRAAAGACDVADNCTGTAGQPCPADAV